MSKELWVLGKDNENRHILRAVSDVGIRSAVVCGGIDGSGDVPAIREFVIDSPESVNSVTECLGRDERIFLRLSGWKIIPLENIISRSRGTKILVAVSDADDADMCLNVLERGADGLVIDSDDEDTIKRISEIFFKESKEKLSVADVSSVKHIGTGDRVCIDSIRLMSQKEGMLIGSHASCLFLVQSESNDNGYIETRPFRVNAGSVHSYILVTGGRTRYLSELRGGDPLLIVDSAGHAAATSAGRCKIETRPMVMIEAVSDGTEHSVILQNAETVCLLGPEGAFPVTSIKKGDKVYVRKDIPGRHCGTPVEEKVREL